MKKTLIISFLSLLILSACNSASQTPDQNKDLAQKPTEEEKLQQPIPGPNDGYIQQCHYSTKNLTCGKESPMCTMILTPTDYCGKYARCLNNVVVKDPEYDKCVDCFTAKTLTKECQTKFPGNEVAPPLATSDSTAQ